MTMMMPMEMEMKGVSRQMSAARKCKMEGGEESEMAVKVVMG